MMLQRTPVACSFLPVHDNIVRTEAGWLGEGRVRRSSQLLMEHS